MNLTKVVDGVTVSLTAEEISARLAEEAAWLAGQADRDRAIRIAELKRLLAETDYVALSDYDKDKADVIAQRAAWRAEIRELEA